MNDLCTCGAPLSYCKSRAPALAMAEEAESFMQRVKREVRNHALEVTALDLENQALLGMDGMSFLEWCEWFAARLRAEGDEMNDLIQKARDAWADACEREEAGRDMILLSSHDLAINEVERLHAELVQRDADVIRHSSQREDAEKEVERLREDHGDYCDSYTIKSLDAAHSRIAELEGDLDAARARIAELEKAFDESQEGFGREMQRTATLEAALVVAERRLGHVGQALTDGKCSISPCSKCQARAALRGDSPATARSWDCESFYGDSLDPFHCTDCGREESHHRGDSDE